MLEVTPEAMALLLQGTGGNGGGGGGADITPPLSPVGVFNNGATSSQFTTNWSSNSEPDLDDYRVYRSSVGASSGFALVGTIASPGLSFNHTGLSAETQYWSYVTAVDNVGNESSPSTVATITTEAASTGGALYDVTSIRHNSSNGDYTAGTSRTPPAWVTDGTLRWPTLPSPSTTQTTVTTMAELQTAVGQNTIQITIPASFGTQSGNVTVTGDDVDVIMSNSATISGDLTFSGNRTRWVGGNNVAGHFEPEGCNDLLVDDFFADNTSGSGNNWGGGAGEHNRIALLNSTLRLRNASGDWCVFKSPTNIPSDWIFANVVMDSMGQTTRFQDVDNLVIIDSVLDPLRVAVSALRIHRDCDNVWWADSDCLNGVLMDARSGGTYCMTNGTFERGVNYSGLNAFATDSDQNNSVLRDWEVLTTSANAGNPIFFAGFSDGGNVRSTAWNGSTIPDYSNYGAQR